MPRATLNKAITFVTMQLPTKPLKSFVPFTQTHSEAVRDALSSKLRPTACPPKIANSNERFDVNKVDIFYYVYGILHSPEYRSRFEANLQKELPRIPLSRNFREFCAAGRALAKLHLGYEAIEPWPVKEVGSSLLPGPVQKIKWGKRKDSETGKKVDDHTVLIYNENLVIKDIPEAAQRYTVNGRSRWNG